MNPRLALWLARQNSGGSSAVADPDPSSVKKDETGVRVTKYRVFGIDYTVTYSAGVTTLTSSEGSLSYTAADLGDIVPQVTEFSASVDFLSFSSFTGTNAPSQTITVSSNDGSAVTITPSGLPAWASITPTSAPTPATFTVSVNQASIAADTTATDAFDLTPTGYAAISIPIDYDVRALPTSSTFSLQYSSSNNRNSPAALSGATITGNQYVFVPGDPAILSVSFYLDDTGMAGAPLHTENSAPWDLNGGTASVATAYDFSALSAGSHTITAKVTKTTAAGGGFETITATFTKGGSAPGTQPTDKKWNPGHYFRVGASLSGLSGILSQIKTHPHSKGALLWVYWDQIEPTSQGVYDWSILDSAIAQCEAVGKKLIVQIPWVAFNQRNMAPAYILSGSQYLGGTSTQWTTAADGTKKFYKRWAKLWVTAVMDRFIAMINAMGTRYNGSEGLEMVILNEVFGPAKTAETLTGFTVDGYLTQMKRLFLAMETAFPNTQIAQMYNWQVWKDSTGAYDCDVLFDYAATLGQTIAFPDVFMTTNTYLYPRIRAAKNQRAVLASLQDKGAKPQFDSGVMTYQSAIDFLTTDPAGITSNYIVWDSWAFGTVYTVSGAIAGIDAASGAINTTVPSGIAN